MTKIKYRVHSGEYETIVTESSCRGAADLAIRLHDIKGLRFKLGELTLVEKLDRQGNPDGEGVFIHTALLIEANTNGFGEDGGQYRRTGE